MSQKTIGILSPGDMGNVVGQALASHGLRVITCLEGRSERTRALATQADLEDVGTYPAFVAQAEAILSILVPAQAPAAAERVAAVLKDGPTDLLYVDCNAIAPQTVRQIGALMGAAGARFVDASIVGGPPRDCVGAPPDPARSTRFYAAGPDVAEFESLVGRALNVRVLGAEIGQASAIKMCYASLTKGLTALTTELMVASQALGVFEPLQDEFRSSQAALYQRIERGLPRMPIKARRFVGEMEEIAQTFEQVGLTPRMLAGAADIYRFVGQSSLADRTPEDTDPDPSLPDLLRALAGMLPS